MTTLADRIKNAGSLHVYEGSTESGPYLADIKQIRRSNMLELIGREASKAAFARKVGTDPAYISQLLSHKTRAEIGDAFARNVEKAYTLPHGWMDNVHAQSKSESTELIERIQGRLDSLFWGWADLARAMGMTEQRLNNWRTRGVPARELRKVEVALQLPRHALDVDVQQTASATEHAELLEAWGYLLPAEKQAIMEQIRLKVTHNKAVLEQLQKPKPDFTSASSTPSQSAQLTIPCR